MPLHPLARRDSDNAPLSSYSPIFFVNCPVRAGMPDGVGAGEKNRRLPNWAASSDRHSRQKLSQSGPRMGRTLLRRSLSGRLRRSIPFLRLRVATMSFTTRKRATAGTMPGGRGKLRARPPAIHGSGFGISGRRLASRQANSARRCITFNQLSATAPLPLPSGITRSTTLVRPQGSS